MRRAGGSCTPLRPDCQCEGGMSTGGGIGGTPRAHLGVPLGLSVVIRRAQGGYMMTKKKILGTAMLLMLGVGVLTVPSPAPEAAAPCVRCPDVPVPSECPACYEWAPETCRQCGHCERIKHCSP